MVRCSWIRVLAAAAVLVGGASASAQKFANTNPITIPVGAPGTTSGIADPYGSTIDVAAVVGPVARVTVTLFGVTHSRPDDIDVLLVSPNGTALRLMSDCGDSMAVAGIDLTLYDLAASNLPNIASLTTGSFRPTNFGVLADNFPAPAPATNAATLAAFNGQDPNGTWTLYVVDDANLNVGAFTGGWSIEFLCGIEVTNTNDDGPGSLRSAVAAADVHPALDVICFNIPGPGPHVISLASGLEQIDQPLIIDGLTQPDAAHDTWPPTLQVVLDGTNAGGAANGLLFGETADASIIRGLVIQNFALSGIVLSGADDCKVQCNFIGTDSTGASAAANGVHGVGLSPTLLSPVIGNVIGVDGDGIGDEHERNLISGNSSAGIELLNAFQSVIAGNFIGTAADGNSALPNAGNGVQLRAVLAGTSSANRVGTNADGVSDELERNIISGNEADGLAIAVFALNSSLANLIAGNFIGVGADSVTPVPNGGHGVRIEGPLADENRVGFDQPGSDNPAKSNVIAHNGGEGVVVLGDTFLNAAQGNWIRGNSIHSNGQLGIDLGGDGVTPNDDDDLDNGANQFKNFPVITSIVGTLISGTYNSIANTTYDIDLYQSSSADSSGHGEGEIHLGSTTVTTDSNGDGLWSLNVVFRGTVLYVSATATDRGVARGTSEFSENAETGVATCVPECPEDIIVNNDSGICSAEVEFGPILDELCIEQGYTVRCTIPDGMGNGTEISSPHVFPVGTTTVTCEFANPDGSLAEVCSFDVTVNNVEMPTIECPDNIETDNDDGVCGATVSFEPEIVFPCEIGRGLYEIVCVANGVEITSPHFFPVGVTTVECCVYVDPPALGDKGGPQAPIDCCTFTVTVTDDEDPVLVCKQNAEVEGGRCGTVILTAADIIESFTDNCPLDCCDPDLLGEPLPDLCGISFSPEVLECPPLNVPIPIAVTGVDCHGNTATCVATVIVRGDDCNNNGLADACDVCSGFSLDCNDNWVPDECECFWCNVREPFGAAELEPEVNAQLSHLGGGTPCGEKVADDFYLEPGCVHRITAVRGKLLTNSYEALRRARIEIYDDCDGKPVDEPFFTADYTQDEPIPSEVIDVQPAADGFSVVTYRFDLCDECIWLEGGKTYWVSIIGLTDHIDHVDLSYWVAGDERLPLLGSIPVKRSGTPGATWGSCSFGPWESIEDCCIGCVNMDFCVDGYTCPIIWDNGDVDLVARGGSASGAHQQYNDRTADSFVVKTCRDEELCLIEAWIWTNCDPAYGFIEFYEDLACGPPKLEDEPFRRYDGEEVEAKKYDDTWVVNGRTYHLWRLQVKAPDLTLIGGHNYWLSAGAVSTGNFNTNSFFAWSKYGCDPCNGTNTFRITPGQHRTLRPPATEWADVLPARDFAFTIAAKAEDAIPQDGEIPEGPFGTPDCVGDTNNDGNVAVDDIFTFLAAWFSGCP